MVPGPTTKLHHGAAIGIARPIVVGSAARTVLLDLFPMDGVDPYELLMLEAAERGGLGGVVALLSPPRILWANPAAASVFGVSREELLLSQPFDFVVPEQRPLLAERLRRRLAGESLPPATFTIARPDGTRIDITCQIVDVTLERTRAAAIFIAEASERQAVDIGADARYRALVDAAPDGVAVTRGGNFLYANAAALELLGCESFEELSKKSLADTMPPEDAAVMRDRTMAMLRTGERFPPRDYAVVRPGPRRVAEISSMVIDFEGAPAILAFARDVTEARRVQADLGRAHRLTALGTLVAGVAHEVNNPLAYASMATELLERFLDEGCRDVKSGRAALTNVSAALDRIAALVRDLRASVRPDVLEAVALPLSEILSSALRMTSSSIRDRATLDADFAQLPSVSGVPGRLEQVFVNLLINATQSFEGDDVARNVVRVRATHGAGELTVVVEDNGRGIAPEDLPKVFDPFFTTKASGEGTGLGLSISDATVRQSGGRIDVSSVLGEGTRVTVALPVATERPAVMVGQPARPSSQRRRVLVVDDEPAIGMLLDRILSPSHDLVVTTCATEAEEVLMDEGADFDVVLCDLTMPRLSGAALFARTRERRPDLASRFVLMSGGLFQDDALARAGGADLPRLEKPFTAAEVSALIERVAAAND